MLAAGEETDDTAGPRTVCKKTQEGFARRPAGTAAVRDPRELPWRRTGGGAELLCLPACPTAAGHGQLGAGGRLALSAGCWEGREGKMFVFLPG